MADFKEATQKTEELVRNIWLAGLGSYRKNLGMAQEQLEGTAEKTQNLFDDLVSRGQKVEADAKEKLEDTQSRIRKASDKIHARRDDLLKESRKSLEGNIKLDDVKTRLEELRNKVAKKADELPLFNPEDAFSQASKKLDEAREKIASLVKS